VPLRRCTGAPGVSWGAMLGRVRMRIAGEEDEEVTQLRLVVQVPCLNEEETLPLVLESIPKEIPGID